MTFPHALLLLVDGSQSDQGQLSISVLPDLHIGTRPLAPRNVSMATPDFGCTLVFSTSDSFWNFEYLLLVHIAGLAPFRVDWPMIT